VNLQRAFGLPSLCPVCLLPGGFHDPLEHVAHAVPRELVKQTGWHKKEEK
jgi:hypothetical protein